MTKYRRLFIAIFLVIILMPGIAHAETNDVNGDGQVNIADAIYIFVYLFAGGPPPPGENIWVMDINGDGWVDMADGVTLLCIIFGCPTP